MMKIQFSIILVAVLLASCQSTETKSNVKPYGNWGTDISKVYCIAGVRHLSYDDTLGEISEGRYDKLAKGVDWSISGRSRLIESRVDVVAETRIYVLRFSSLMTQIVYRLVSGKSKTHSIVSKLDTSFLKKGYHRMHGEVSVAGEIIDNPVVCWGSGR